MTAGLGRVDKCSDRARTLQNNVKLTFKINTQHQERIVDLGYNLICLIYNAFQPTENATALISE